MQPSHNMVCVCVCVGLMCVCVEGEKVGVCVVGSVCGWGGPPWLCGTCVYLCDSALLTKCARVWRSGGTLVDTGTCGLVDGRLT